MVRGFIWLWGAILLGHGGLALSDSTLIFERVLNDGQEQQQPPMYIANGMIRFAPEGKGKDQYMLFDAGKKVFTVVDEQSGTYTPMNSDSFDQLSAMQRQMMETMEAQLAQLPEEQRAEALRMMQGMGQMPTGDDKPKVHTERTARTMSVNGYRCTVLEVYRGEKKTSETCVSTRDALGMPADDYRTLMAMQDFLMQVSSSFFDMDDSSYFYGDAARQEIPVHIVDYSDGGQRVTRFRSADFGKIDRRLFRIDPSLRERDLMSGMGR